MSLTDSARQALNFVEQEYLLTGAIPTYDAYENRFKTLACPRETWIRWFKDQEFLDALDRRGITSNLQSTLGGNGVLTERQLYAVNSVLDFRNKKSTKTKLADVGVTTSEYAAWLRDPGFQNYLRQRAEKVLDSEMATAHNALVSAVDKGDIRAVQLYYEMTGRWSSKTTGELNINFVMIKILEIIQTHVRDSATLEAIARDLETLTAGPVKQELTAAPVQNYNIMDIA